jgi:hypothetical protein
MRAGEQASSPKNSVSLGRAISTNVAQYAADPFLPVCACHRGVRRGGRRSARLHRPERVRAPSTPRAPCALRHQGPAVPARPAMLPDRRVGRLTARQDGTLAVRFGVTRERTTLDRPPGYSSLIRTATSSPRPGTLKLGAVGDSPSIGGWESAFCQFVSGDVEGGESDKSGDDPGGNCREAQRRGERAVGHGDRDGADGDRREEEASAWAASVETPVPAQPRRPPP